MLANKADTDKVSAIKIRHTTLLPLKFVSFFSTFPDYTRVPTLNGRFRSERGAGNHFWKKNNRKQC